MKLNQWAVVVVCGSLLLGAAQGQEKKDRGGAGGGDRQAQMEQRANEMLDKLGVTGENKDKIKALLKEEGEKIRAKFQELQGKGDAGRGQMREEMQKIQEETIKKIKEQKLLTDDQIAKWKEMRQQAFQARGQGKKKE